LNQNQKKFLWWLVETVKKEGFNEDNLIFLFMMGATKLIDHSIEKYIPEEMNLQRATLDALEEEGCLTCQREDGDYVCSLMGKAYQIVATDFSSSPEEPRGVVNQFYNDFRGAQIGNVANELKDSGQQTASIFTQNPQTAELLKLITEIQQATATLPPEAQSAINSDLQCIKAEAQKSEADRHFPSLRQSLTQIVGSISKGASVINGVNNIAKASLAVKSLAEAFGIHLQLPPGV
jgi:hypothetical protein